MTDYQMTKERGQNAWGEFVPVDWFGMWQVAQKAATLGGEFARNELKAIYNLVREEMDCAPELATRLVEISPGFNCFLEPNPPTAQQVLKYAVQPPDRLEG